MSDETDGDADAEPCHNPVLNRICWGVYMALQYYIIS